MGAEKQLMSGQRHNREGNRSIGAASESPYGLRGISEAEYCLVEREDGPKRWMLGYIWNELGKSMRSERIRRSVGSEETVESASTWKSGKGMETCTWRVYSVWHGGHKTL